MHDGWIDGLRTLASRGHEISVIHVLAPEERNPELTGDLKLIDSEDNAEVEITADYDLLSRYRQNLQEWQAGLRAFCRSRNITYVPVETTLELDELLFAWLQRQGVLR
jgi:5'-deoxynucleotidase YfbR-like HD superfamily hydrolase